MPTLDVQLRIEKADAPDAASFDAVTFRRRLAKLLHVEGSSIDTIRLAPQDDGSVTVSTSIVAADATVCPRLSSDPPDGRTALADCSCSIILC